MNPPDGRAQRGVERLAQRLVLHPVVRQARQAARASLLEDPVALRPDGLSGLDDALDHWVLALALRVANGDPFRPGLIRVGCSPVCAPLGQTEPDASVAIDNPDEIDREVPIDAASRYVIRGRHGGRPDGFRMDLVAGLDGHPATGRTLCSLAGRQIVANAGGFTVTIDADAAGNRSNHLRTAPGPLRLLVRDTLSDWRQAPAILSIERLAGPDAPPAPDEAVLVAGLAHALPDAVDAWRGIKDSLLDDPEPNRLAGPVGLPGSGRYLARGRFEVAADEALLVTAIDGTASYTGCQVTGPWAVPLDPASRLSSLNISQTRADEDGTCLYVLSSVDPGAHNWIDVGGLAEGWMLLRWQGLPAGAHPRALVKTVRRVRLEALAGSLPRGTPMLDPAGRARQVAARQAGYRGIADAWP